MALAGEIADPGAYADDTRQLVARGSRNTSSSTTTTTEIPVLRLDGVQLKSGRAYRIETPTLLLSSSVGGDEVWARLRIATGGATAGIASTEIAFASAKALGSVTLATSRYPAADEVVSIVLTVVRQSGSGNVMIQDTGADPAIEVYHRGLDTGDVGVPL